MPKNIGADAVTWARGRPLEDLPHLGGDRPLVRRDAVGLGRADLRHQLNARRSATSSSLLPERSAMLSFERCSTARRPAPAALW
jgi:hypothetical protein